MPQWPCNPAPVTARIQHDTVSSALSGRGMDPLSRCCIVPHHQTHSTHNTSQNCSHAYIHIPSCGPRCVLWQNSDRTANPQFSIWVIYTAAACQVTERTLISIPRDPNWENDIIPGKPLNWPLAHKLFQIGRAWHTHSYACIHGCSCVVFNECPFSLHMNRGHVKLAWHWCSSHLCKWCKPFVRYLFVHLNDSLNTSTHFSVLWSQHCGSRISDLKCRIRSRLLDILQISQQSLLKNHHRRSVDLTVIMGIV